MRVLGRLAGLGTVGLGTWAAGMAWGQAPPAPPAAPASTLIQGGTVVDGTGAKGVVEDVRVSGERIEAVGRLRPRAGERVLDARRLIVAPGFIDAHSHADGGLLEDPNAETMIRQGITTSVVGQDGGSHFPLKDYFAQLENKHVALNIASFVGHGTMRQQVMGRDYKRAATPAETAQMQALVAQEMDSGGLGLSSGLEYDPGFYSTTGELVALASVAGKRGGLYISHVRDEGDKVFDSFRELIAIGRDGHMPAQVSHIKLDTSPVWGKSGDALALMDEAARRGQDVSADVYPYTFWQSTITVIIPTRDWSDRAAWTKGLAEVGGPSHILLTNDTADPEWQGKTVAQIAALTRQDAVSVVQAIVAHTHGPSAKPGASESVVVTAMTEDDVRRFVASPRVMFCTDGSLHPSHPRGAGSFPRVLGRYVREQRALTLEAAIHKMTGLPAARFGFARWGRVAPGFQADLVLFDPKTVLDKATTADPAAAPVGLPDVFVNGALVLDNGAFTGAHPGEALRRTAAGA